MNRSKSPTHGNQRWHLVIPSDFHQLALARPLQFEAAEALAQPVGLGSQEEKGRAVFRQSRVSPGWTVCLSPRLSPWEKKRLWVLWVLSCRVRGQLRAVPSPHSLPGWQRAPGWIPSRAGSSGRAALLCSGLFL